MFKDYYQILGVSPTASKQEIKQAYRMMSLKWHPDKNPGVDVTSMMQDINEAYKILNDDLCRARYDKERGFMRELAEVTEFYVDEENKPKFNVIYHKNVDGTEKTNEPSKYLIEYLANQGVDLNDDSLVEEIDYDALDDLAKADQKLEAEKQEKKEEEAYIANFGEDPVEEEEVDTGPKVEPQIDFSKLNQPKEEVKKETPSAEAPKVTEEDVNSFIEAIKKAKETSNQVSAPVTAPVETPPIEAPVAPNPVEVPQAQPEVPPVVPVVDQQVSAPAVPAPAPAPVTQASTEYSYDNLYNYDYSATSGEIQPASNPLDIEKTQYLDPVNPNVGSPNNV